MCGACEISFVMRHSFKIKNQGESGRALMSKRWVKMMASAERALGVRKILTIVELVAVGERS